MKSPILRRLALSLSLVSALLAAPVHAQSSDRDLSTGLVVVSVMAPVAFISDISDYKLTDFWASLDGTYYVVERVSDGVSGSITVGRNISGAASLGVGESLRFVTTTSGTLLVAAGNVLAIIPTAMGKALLKSEKLS
ncbi:hypothetical protein HFRIS_000220 [Herbaspirillum frisingense GSF30]|uniref:Uncharacterized protein n=1 Tax=Herbaspirillum frisingense GSF30 TaxID=864073 RepID=A0AAI9IID9_9BURK|nr:hypothetical protein [Herbaspirillum frisingense]EOA06691.1 hypothetical protein HFRIS_000220 [Herbaspirillum frisingense GSF30]